MKYFILSLVLLAVSAAVYGEDTIDNCSCWDGFKPGLIDSKPMCVGIRLFAIKPCNIPQAPRCVCDPNEVTSITTDATGTWCAKNDRGVEVKRWACENKDEWEVFKKELANKS